MRYVVAYDIAHARGRKRVHDRLSELGEAVNLSVFEVELRDQRAVDALIAELRKLIAPAHDRVRLVPMARDWRERQRDLGAAKPSQTRVEVV